ncbi:hypothetical protein [Chitinophaga filiformis]|uniref:Uncharacterized protein n=1 Tax=Chitinophaga filiformis TaxID=104663 RepID=A0A1G7HN56_CHIFI|nr:hypothetical protein [Chitinophaga filiformis]SDF01644.1 hypothetical protein SAMN04488121_101531 [Chitinophaga filiformis]
MAKSTNFVLKDASGTIADMLTLTKRRSGAIILGKKRGESSIPPSELQLDVQRKFKRAMQYAKAAILDPVVKAAYQAFAGPDQSAYNMAVKDFFKPPVVESITTKSYHGEVGDTLLIRALDDFKVTAVTVSIRTAAGAIVEEGNAVLQSNALDWLYTATAENAALAGTVITATAVDTPGNETPKEVVL